MPQSLKVNSQEISSASLNKKWVCVELSLVGEKEKKLHLIQKSARQILGDQTIEVFIPATVQKVRDESHVLSFMEGYIFVSHKENLQYTKLQDTAYFKSILTKPAFENGRRKQMLSLLDDTALSPMRQGVENLNLSGFNPGDGVQVVKGNFRNLKAEVIQVYDDHKTVQIYVDLRSKKMLIDYPASYLIKI